MINRYYWKFLILAGLAVYVQSLSDEMKEMAMMLHNDCKQEAGVEEDVIQAAIKGNIADDPKLKCYMKCLYGNMGAISDEGEIDTDALAAIIPEDIAEFGNKAIAACKDVKGADACEIAYNLNVCMQKFDPAHYLLI